MSRSFNLVIVLAVSIVMCKVSHAQDSTWLTNLLTGVSAIGPIVSAGKGAMSVYQGMQDYISNKIDEPPPPPIPDKEEDDSEDRKVYWVPLILPPAYLAYKLATQNQEGVGIGIDGDEPTNCGCTVCCRLCQGCQCTITNCDGCPEGPEISES